MAKRSRTEAGSSFLEGILSKIPEDKRTVAQEILNPLVDDLGDGVLRQDEFSRKMNELAAKDQENEAYKNRLDQWYNDNLTAIETGTRALRGELEGAPASTPSSDEPPQINLKEYVKKSEVERMISTARTSAASEISALTAAMQGLGFQYFRDFKEPPDPDFGMKVWQVAAQKQISMDSAYAELTRERREELNKSRREAERKQMEEEIRVKVTDELRSKNGPLPYAVPNSEPTTLIGLQRGATAAVPDYGVQAALNEFYRSQKP